MGAFLLALPGCKAPEVRACEDFVDVLRECTDKNGGASSEGESEDEYETCESVDPECEAFFECAAKRPCTDDNAINAYTIDVSGCEMPEGVICL